MRKIAYLLILTLSFVGGATLNRTDIGSLKPIEAIRISKNDARFTIETDTGDFGAGETLLEAVSHLSKTSAGYVYLDTAAFVIAEENVLEDLVQLRNVLRKGSYLLVENGWANISDVASFLKAHQTDMTFRDYLAGERDYPILSCANGRYEIAVEGP